MAKPPKRRGTMRGSLDARFNAIGETLTQRLHAAQRGSHSSIPRLSPPELTSLAALLIELAEDLHCGIGIWRTLEAFQRESFGTPLPFATRSGADLPPGTIAPERVRHFLWVWWGQTFPDHAVRPDDPTLIRLADLAAKVLRDEFRQVARRSATRDWFESPITFGWEAKEKLIWLGTQSYLFRDALAIYLDEHLGDAADAADANAKIPVIDDFLNQQCTLWAGLGALDILAGILPLPPERRAELLTWSERHHAFYRVLVAGDDQIQVLNLINDQEYLVRLNIKPHPFRRDLVVAGNLVPWDGAWYWSGTQELFPKLGKTDIRDLKQRYRTLTNIYYRLHPGDLDLARRLVRGTYDQFVARHGRDWTVFPNGRAMADDWQAATRETIAQASPAEQQSFFRRHKRKPTSPGGFPREIAATKESIGVYFNPDEGQELVRDFDTVLAGLAKRGSGLSTVEAEAIQSFIRSENVSPGFVHRVTAEFGVESVASVFLLDEPERDYTLDYLLRRYKGHFDRPRYPTLILVDS